MQHPFEILPITARMKLFWVFLVLSLIVVLVFRVIGTPLNTSAAPMGVVSFELAGSVDQAQAMIESWNQRARLYAAFGLGFDYLFMLVYSTAIGLGCVMAAGVLRRQGWPLAQLGGWLAWGLWLAAGCDAVENIALSVLLLEKAVSPWPVVAWWCATIKFALIFISLVYAFLGLAANLAGRLSRGKSG